MEITHYFDLHISLMTSNEPAVTVSGRLHEHSDEHKLCYLHSGQHPKERMLLQWLVMSADDPAIMFLNFLLAVYK